MVPLLPLTSTHMQCHPYVNVAMVTLTSVCKRGHGNTNLCAIDFDAKLPTTVLTQGVFVVPAGGAQTTAGDAVRENTVSHLMLPNGGTGLDYHSDTFVTQHYIGLCFRVVSPAKHSLIRSANS